MLDWLKLGTTFNAVNISSAKDISQTVNYVWIDEKPFTNLRQGESNIPRTYLSRLFKNARHYPEAQFHIWTDFELAGDLALERLQQQIRQWGSSNVTIKNLHEIAGIFRSGQTRRIDVLG